MVQTHKKKAGARWLMAGAGLLLACSSAHADLWAYVDDKGTTHFAAEQVDERYELYFKGPEAELVKPIEALALTPSLGLIDGAGMAVKPNVGLSVAAAPSEPKLKAPAPQLPTRFARIESSSRYKAASQHLRAAAKAHGIDYELLKAVAAAESGFDPVAVSPAGAVGLMQLMPTTAAAFGVKASGASTVEQLLTDPATNAKAGARYLNYLLKMFKGDLELAVAAYNAGEGNVRRAGNRVPNFRETRNYVKTVLQLYSVFKPGAVEAASPSVGGTRATAQAAGSGRVRVQMR